MQRYKSHKIVEAAKIIALEGGRFADSIDTVLRAKCDDGESYDINRAMVSRYTPKPGDYLVKYRDGYLSISPAKEFEDGYIMVAPEGKSGGRPGSTDSKGQASGESLNPFRKVYRTLTPEEAQAIELLKDQAWLLWRKLDALPPGRHVALAKTALEESVMWAVKAATA